MMAISTNNQEKVTNHIADERGHPNDDNHELPSNTTNNDSNYIAEDKDASAETENDNLNISTIMEAPNPNVEENASSANASAMASDRNILTSPQNTIGLPCSENREDSVPATNSENEQIMSNHIPPALPPRPINLQSPQVNGLPHPPHGFNASQGKFVVNGVYLFCVLVLDFLDINVTPYSCETNKYS